MSFGIWELVIILLIVALLFGTKKLRSMGSDLGSAVKGFRSAVSDADKESLVEESAKGADKGRIIDAEIEKKEGSSHKA